MILEKLIQRLPLAALAIQASQGSAQIHIKDNVRSTDCHVDAPQSKLAHSTAEEIVLSSDGFKEAEPYTFQVVYHYAPDSWTSALQKKYDALVTKEAIGSITTKELNELDGLQKIRRQLESPLTGEEVLQRYKREKLDQDLLKVLQRHVRLQPLTKNRA